MNKDNRANRYSLVSIDMFGNTKTIEIAYNGKVMSKLPLATIDRMTTNYNSESEFLSELMNIGYDFGHLYIEYRVNRETKYIDVAYADNIEIAEESTYREEAINSGKEEPKRSKNVIELSYKLINIQRRHKKLWSYLQLKNYISSKLVLLIATYNYFIDTEVNENDILEYYQDITREISNYRVFRDISYGINEYEKHLKKENKAKKYKKTNI